MRLTKYNLIKEDGRPTLLKEKATNYEETCLSSPEKIVDMFNSVFNANKMAEEHVWLLAFNTKFKPLGVFEISHGTVNLTLISPREIFIRLLLCGASKFVVAHCHPSGNTEPSKEDIKMTVQIQAAAKLINVELVDHIIIGDDFFSFKQNDLL